MFVVSGCASEDMNQFLPNCILMLHLQPLSSITPYYPSVFNQLLITEKIPEVISLENFLASGHRGFISWLPGL